MGWRSVLGLWIASAAVARAKVLPGSYDVTWTGPGTNGSQSSMPVGGGDLGLNVWVENGTLLFYIGQGGSFDENNSLLKLGRVRLAFDPNPFEGDSWTQTLVLEDGYLQLKAGNSTQVDIWVDVYNSIIHLDGNLGQPSGVSASFESWRYEDRNISKAEQAQSSWDGANNDTIYTYADSTWFYDDSSVLSYHRNQQADILWATIAEQGLQGNEGAVYDTLTDNTFGLLMQAPGFSQGNISDGYYVNASYKSWNLESNGQTDSFNITITTYQNQTDSADTWQSCIVDKASNQGGNTRQPSLDWWHTFWHRSHIIINANASDSDTGFQVGRNYQLFRYFLACNAFSTWPSKFNGGTFTFDPYWDNNAFAFSPDFRRWGGGTWTAQNQRLMSWPLLKTGDLDLMMPQFEFYKNIVAINKVRGQTYFGVDEVFWSEQIDGSGLQQYFDFEASEVIYNYPRPANLMQGLPMNGWTIWETHTALEFVQMMLDAKQYFNFDISPYMEFVESSIIFYDTVYTQFQRERDIFGYTGLHGNETLVFYPSSACETYKVAYNPAPLVSGLRAVITRLLQVDPPLSCKNTTYYETLLTRIPKTPTRFQQGHECIAPAEAYARIQNVEIPQLYPVWPWHEYGIGLPNLTTAINTYLYDTETQAFHGYDGWTQDAIWLADMGLTDMAKNVTTLKMQDSQLNRFPAFWGPGLDWTPQMDSGGTGMAALQEMVLQTYGNNSKEIRVAPSWPSDWTVDFKLHAPFNTTVEGHVEGGQVSGVVVEPSSRMGDVVMGQ